MVSEDRDLSIAEHDARLAVKMAPWDYNHRLLLAGIEETQGDRASARQRREAIAGPQLSGCTLALGEPAREARKAGESLSEFRTANSSSIALLPASST
jgi:hypothetical protein